MSSPVQRGQGLWSPACFQAVLTNLHQPLKAVAPANGQLPVSQQVRESVNGRGQHLRPPARFQAMLTNLHAGTPLVYPRPPILHAYRHRRSFFFSTNLHQPLKAVTAADGQVPVP